MFDAIAFAGGGNRCYWQGGFYEAVADRLALPPKLAVGVSAGAFACIYSILGIGPLVGAAIGIGCYQVEKHLFHPVHPRLGRMLGFRAEFIRVRDLATPSELRDTILASGCVPPFMPLVVVGGKPGFDGGLVDNVPVGPIEPIEAAGGRTLVLLTRIYRRVPKMPGRTYVQPSRPIGAKQFDVTNPAVIRD